MKALFSGEESLPNPQARLDKESLGEGVMKNCQTVIYNVLTL